MIEESLILAVILLFILIALIVFEAMSAANKKGSK